MAMILSDIAASFGEFLTVISYTWFIVLPIAGWWFFKFLWMKHIQLRYLLKMRFTLLEIIPPQNIEKSPQPIESLFLAMAAVVRTPTVFEEFLDGYFTDPFSLEIVGKGGDGAHIYIRTPAAMRSMVESHLYAQYPEVEIAEVPDYVDEVPAVVPNKDWNLWGTDFELTDPDPMPIKTYRHFEEDVTGKMIDPMAGLIEILGQLPPGQHLWFQLTITPLPEKWTKTVGLPFVQEKAGRVSKKASPFEKIWIDITDIVKGVFTGIFSPPEFAAKEEKKEEQPLEFRLTPGEKRTLEALEANVGKNVYDTKMRMVYLGRRDSFDKATFVSGFIGGIKQFSDQNSNGFKPNDASKTYANYVLRDSRLKYRQRKIFSRYKDRDPTGKTVLLSTEELASIFHLPDMAVVSPFIRRVAAKRGSAPSNLPF